MAFPQHAYRDPALIAEGDELHALGCAGCARAVPVMDEHLCPNALRYPACKRNHEKGYQLARSVGGER